MNKLRKITVEVSAECWKKLKVVSIQKDATLQEVVREILEKNASRRNIENVEITD